MDDRTKELIAVGASITANCQPCLQYHVGKAMENGADEREIREAVEAGMAVRKGAIAKMDTFAASLCRTSPPSVPASEEGCGCGS